MERARRDNDPRSRTRLCWIWLWLVLPAICAGCSSCFDRSAPAQQPQTGPARQTADVEPVGDLPGAQQRRIRRSAVAGSWYPADRAQLTRELDAMLATAPAARVASAVIALVSPHAGYRFSGKAAAAGYGLLRGQSVRRVVVLGVSHRVPFEGASIPDVTHYQTPLGLIAVDSPAVARLRRCPVVKTVASAHEQEHSLEMQLPLLQRVAPRFELVPLLLGSMPEAGYGQLAAALADVVDEGTVVVASSDFTHRGPNYGYEVPAGDGSIKQRLAQLDRGAVDRIVALDRAGLLTYQARTGATICGLRPIGTLLELLSRATQVKAHVVSNYTSGDVTGDWTSTVSYVSVAFTGTWPAGGLARASSPGEQSFPLSAGDQKLLLQLARASLDAAVDKGSYEPAVLARAKPTASLQRKAGAFVTLKCRTDASGRCVGRGHELRGCMGTIPPLTPISQTVARRAASAALEDPRFRAVAAEELAHIAVEVSVLTPPRTVAGPEAIVVGRHGVILAKDGRSATFLPQVAPEQGWDRDTTLTQLARKAGLGPDGWRQGASLQVYEAIVFAEHRH